MTVFNQIYKLDCAISLLLRIYSKCIETGIIIIITIIIKYALISVTLNICCRGTLQSVQFTETHH